MSTGNHDGDRGNAPQDAAVRVVVADDHPVVRHGLRALIETPRPDGPVFEVVGEAATGTEAVDVARRERPAVVLMDLRMPDGDGVDATRILVPLGIQVLILTTYDTDADIVRAIEAGAVGYLLKDADPRRVLDGIAAAARGETVLDPPVAARLVGRMRAPGEPALTAREIEVLALVAKGASNAEVAAALHVGTSTVKTHLLHVFDKLGVSDRTAAVTLAYERGILDLGSR